MKYIFIFIISIIIFISCDNRTDYFAERNEVPEFGFYVNDEIIAEKEDSIKGLVEYSIPFKIKDENFDRIEYHFELGGGEIEINYLDSTFFFTPNNFEKSHIVFTAVDKYNTQKDVVLKITSFENLLPQPVINFIDKGDRLFKIDASSSFDEDHQFGGSVTEYHFKIKNDYEVQTVLSSIHYQFNSAGNYLISLRVKDNNNQWSDWYETNLEVAY